MAHEVAPPSETTQAQTAERKQPWAQAWYTHLSLVVAAALVPRLLFLSQLRNWPFFTSPVSDSGTQWEWASLLLHTHGLGNPEVLAKAPLYQYFLAFTQWMSGMEVSDAGRPAALFLAHLLQLLGGAATCGLVYLLGRRIFGWGVGLLAGLMLAWYSPGLYREGQLLDTGLATLLMTGLLLTLTFAFARPADRRVWLGAGVLLGLLALTRPNLGLLLVPIVVLLVVWLKREHGWAVTGRAGGFLLLGFALMLLPMVGRNYLLVHRFVPFSNTGGINLYTGNNPQADGYSPIPSGIAWQRTWAEAAAAGAYDSGTRDAYWQRKAMRFWREQPGRALALLVKKVYLYWNAYEVPNNVSYGWGRAHSSVLRALPLTFAVIGPLGLLGMVLGGWRSRGAWLLLLAVLTQTVAVAAFFIAGRYRMPAVPALCLFGAFGVWELARLVARRRWAWLGLALLGLAGFALFVNSDAYGARRANGANRDWYLLGESYTRSGEYARAKEAFHQATVANPRDADSFSLEGQMALQLGQPEEAARALKHSLAVAPDFTDAAVALADLYLRQNWPAKEARDLLARASQAQPQNVYGKAMLARVDLRLGDRRGAAAALQAAAEALSNTGSGGSSSGPAQQAYMLAVRAAEEAGLTVPQFGTTPAMPGQPR